LVSHYPLTCLSGIQGTRNCLCPERHSDTSRRSELNDWQLTYSDLSPNLFQIHASERNQMNAIV